MVASLYFSFTHYDLLNSPRWIGLANYRYMLHDDPFFWQAVRNTLWMVVIGLPLRLFWALLTATLLTQPAPRPALYRTLFYLPTHGAAGRGGARVHYLLNPDIGPVDQRARAPRHLPAPLWFFDPPCAKPALVLLALWGVGDAMIIYLAGLLDVPRSLYRGRRYRRRQRLRRYRHVTLPLLSPVIFFTLVIGSSSAFQTSPRPTSRATRPRAHAGRRDLDAPGRAAGHLLFYAMWLYQQGFRYFNMGYASAMAWLLFWRRWSCTLLLSRPPIAGCTTGATSG